MVNDQGYPFKWDVYPGNMAEVNTLMQNIDSCKRRFKLKNVTIVFDRGIVSEKNMEYIAAEGLKFISAMDRDQISKITNVPNVPNVDVNVDVDVDVGGIDLSVFTQVNAEPDNYRQILLDNGFEQYDDSLFIKDLGVINKRRYVLGFNSVFFKEERENRLERIASFEKFLANKNNELKNANRSRKRETTRQCILSEMGRMKIKKFFEKPCLRKLTIKRERKKRQKGQKGQKGKPVIVTINSFSVTIRKKKDIISHWEKFDGLCVFVSNHTEVEKKNGHFLVPNNKIIMAYREKTKIEDAFKHIKSFLKIRPFFVNTDEHVRAVYTISVLAYFINKDLAERRKRIEGIDYLNSKNLYAPFKKFYYGTVKDCESGKTKSEPMEFTPEIEDYISRLSIKSFKSLM